MKHSVFQRSLAWLIAAILLLGTLPYFSPMQASASESTPFEKIVIFNGGSAGKTVNRTAGQHVEFSHQNFNLNIPTTLSQEDLGIYILVTLDAPAAEAMNKGGSIELAYRTCDKSELSCNTTVVNWKAGLNEVVIPIGKRGGYTDGGEERFDMYETINWFRFYTTPGTASLSANSSIVIHEVAIVDSAMAGIEFGADSTYLQLGSALSATPNTIEASIKTSTLSTSWTLGTYSGARYGEGIMTSKSGTVKGVEGIPDGTPYVGGTVHKGGYFGTKDLVNQLSIPKAYSIDQLALTFWLYTSTGEVTKSYLELTSSGKCDVEELCWTTKDAEFSDLKPGWNKIVLPLSSRSGAGFDYSRINFSRFWGSQNAGDKATQEFEMYVTEMVITVYQGQSTPADGYELIDGKPTWHLMDFTKQPQNWDGGKITVGKVWKSDGTSAQQPADGTVYMEVRPGNTLTYPNDHATHAGESYWKGGFTASTGNAFIAPNIPKQYKLSDLTFSFWIYTPDASLIPDDVSADCPNFEFTSDGDVDGAELYYHYMWEKIGGLEDGWNYVEIPLSKMSASGTFDLYGINFLRWTYMCVLKDSGADEMIRFADFRITAAAERSGDGTPTTDDKQADIDPSTTYMIFSNSGSSDASPIALYLTATGNVAWIWGNKSYVSSYNTFTSQWIDLALVRDMSAGTFLLYANGEVVYEEDAKGTADIVPTVPHAIAADAAGQGLFAGWIADVRAWSDVRTAKEINDNRVSKMGCHSNGLGKDTQGLLGSWLLTGITDNILEIQKDTSGYENHASFRGPRADQWVTYTKPTDIVGEDYYTIVFIPDTQELVMGQFTEEWMAAAQWIADNVATENIVHVIGAGDNTWTDAPAQWQIARDGFDLFTSRVSWSNMTGNHDYPGSCLPVNDATHTRRNSTNYQTYFGEAYIEQTEAANTFVEYFEDPYEISTTENAFFRFKVNGIQWMILQLEYLPRAHVIEWAAEVLADYPGDNVILTTHSYITSDNAVYTTQWMPYTKEDSEIGGYLGELEGEDWPNGTSQPIWDKLIYPNANVKLLLCGHAGTTDGHVLTKLSKNKAGFNVPQVMINAQDLDVSYFEGEAMAMLALLRFSADGKKVEIQYYSPYHNGTYHPSNTDMLSLTLDITGTPDVPPTTDQTEDEQPAPDQGTQQQPDDTASGNATVVLIAIAGAVLLVAVVAVALVVVKKKKSK